jgi:hypothetical protein
LMIFRESDTEVVGFGLMIFRYLDHGTNNLGTCNNCHHKW